MPKDKDSKNDVDLISHLNVDKVKRLRQFKIDYGRVRNFKFVDKSKAQTFKEYSKLVPAKKLKITEKARPRFARGLSSLPDLSASAIQKVVLVLVNHDLYASIEASISQYVADLAYEGYSAEVHRINGGTAAELRNFIISKNPLGAVLVGSLPAAWFEIADDFDGPSQFPCDLYYMDLNGTWNDPDGDGLFSEHPTNVQAEIWIGRIWTPTRNGNDAALINNYFTRNHAYRKGLFGYSNKALAFVDEPWPYFGDCAFDSMFAPANIETITDATATTRARYKAEVQQHRAWAQICAHSSAMGHTITEPNGTGAFIPGAYLRDINPPNAYFYNLFTCSSAQFTMPEYMAGWYIFDKVGGSVCNGLAAVGTTKKGGMLFFENFYGPMGLGKTIGDAFVDWWTALGTDHDLSDRKWHYGMTLLGDPTLNWWIGVVPQPRTPLTEDVFDHSPRVTHFNWDPIGLPDVIYNIEIDSLGAITSGKWASEDASSFVSGALLDNNFEHLFDRAARGRWRVRAKVADRTCPWSDWQYFKYTV